MKKLMVKKLNMLDFDDVRRFVLNEYEKLPNKDYFIIDDLDTALPAILAGSGIGYGIFCDGEIVALQAIDWNDDNDELRKVLVDFVNNDEQLLEVGWVLVNEKFKNHSISSKLFHLLEQSCMDAFGKMKLAVTVHPQNEIAKSIYSKLGFKKCITTLHYGLLRDFMIKDVTNER